MAIRRTTAPRKRPAPTTGIVAEPVVAPVVEAVQDETPDDASGMRERALARFTASVQARTDLDDEGRKALLKHYSQAIAEAELSPKLQAPDRAQWVGMLDLMVQKGMLEEADARDLIHGFENAFEVLKSREAQNLLEFAQRCERDGQDKAVEWLESQRAAEAESHRATGAEIPDATQQLSRARVRRNRPTRGPPA
jgi:hypothetical protein